MPLLERLLGRKKGMPLTGITEATQKSAEAILDQETQEKNTHKFHKEIREYYQSKFKRELRHIGKALSSNDKGIQYIFDHLYDHPRYKETWDLYGYQSSTGRTRGLYALQRINANGRYSPTRYAPHSVERVFVTPYNPTSDDNTQPMWPTECIVGVAVNRPSSKSNPSDTNSLQITRARVPLEMLQLNDSLATIVATMYEHADNTLPDWRNNPDLYKDPIKIESLPLGEKTSGK